MAERTYLVTAGEQRLTVTLRREAERTYARVGDGPEQPVRLEPGGGASYTLVVGARHRALLASRAGGQVELALPAAVLELEVEDEARARLAQVAGGSGTTHARRELRAPMPGLVVSVRRQPGDTVEAGEPLVVLQAMKMENELSLPAAGTIASVAVKDGQTVDQGQVLIVLE
ncbi:MAG: biotin/lipoyl-binding protein [Chloroflexi bacterium]|nr:biotin/lipoyl-binding protein [Chloroflexota bacterium]